MRRALRRDRYRDQTLQELCVRLNSVLFATEKVREQEERIAEADEEEEELNEDEDGEVAERRPLFDGSMSVLEAAQDQARFCPRAPAQQPRAYSHSHHWACAEVPGTRDALQHTGSGHVSVRLAPCATRHVARHDTWRAGVGVGVGVRAARVPCLCCAVL